MSLTRSPIESLSSRSRSGRTIRTPARTPRLISAKTEEVASESSLEDNGPNQHIYKIYDTHSWDRFTEIEFRGGNLEVGDYVELAHSLEEEENSSDMGEPSYGCVVEIRAKVWGEDGESSTMKKPKSICILVLTFSTGPHSENLVDQTLFDNVKRRKNGQLFATSVAAWIFPDSISRKVKIARISLNERPPYSGLFFDYIYHVNPSAGQPGSLIPAIGKSGPLWPYKITGIHNWYGRSRTKPPSCLNHWDKSIFERYVSPRGSGSASVGSISADVRSRKRAKHTQSDEFSDSEMGPPTKVAKQGLHNAESVRISRPPPKLRRRAEVNEKLGRTSSTPDQKVESPSIPIPSSLALPTMNINDTSKPEHLGYDGVHAPAGPQDFSLVSVHETENSNAIETSPLMSHTLRVRPNLEILLNPQSRELGNEKDDGALPLSLSRLLTAVSTQATVCSEPNHEDPEPAIAVPSSTVVAVSESTNIKPACISSQSVSPLTTNSNQSSELPIFTTDDTAHLEVCFAYPRSNPETQDASTGIGEPPAKSNVGNKENVQWSFITREQELTLKIKELEAKVESDSHQKSLELETLRVKLENAILDRDTALKKLEFALKENAIVVSSRDAAAEAVNQAEKALDLSQQEKNAIMLERDAAVEAFGQAEQELRDYREYFRLKAKLLIAHTS